MGFRGWNREQSKNSAVRSQREKDQFAARASALVTGGALLGIKSIGRYAEHVVALDADAVDDRTDDGAGLGRFVHATGRRSGGFVRDALSRHGRILARRGISSIAGDGIPGTEKTHPL